MTRGISRLADVLLASEERLLHVTDQLLRTRIQQRQEYDICLPDVGSVNQSVCLYREDICRSPCGER